MSQNDSQFDIESGVVASDANYDAYMRQEEMKALKLSCQNLQWERDYYKRRFDELLAAEHELSDAYIRLRAILGALNPPEVNAKAIWAFTEEKARQLVDARNSDVTNRLSIAAEGAAIAGQERLKEDLRRDTHVGPQGGLLGAICGGAK